MYNNVLPGEDDDLGKVESSTLLVMREPPPVEAADAEAAGGGWNLQLNREEDLQTHNKKFQKSEKFSLLLISYPPAYLILRYMLEFRYTSASSGMNPVRRRSFQ